MNVEESAAGELPEGEPAAPDTKRFSELPQRVAPEDMTTTQDEAVAPDPEVGRRDLHRDILLWGAG